MVIRTDRLERITNLLLALLSTSQPLTLREIGDVVAGYPAELGAIRQAFERDKRTLRDEGIPIATERIGGDDQIGYRILPEHYYLPDLMLDASEQGALAFALAAVRLEGGASRDLDAKLGAAHVSEMPPVVVLPSLPALGILQTAVRTRAPARFTYRGRPRDVCGYALAFKDGSWYFLGAIDAPSDGSPAIRTFRVDRIEDSPLLGDPGAYELPEHFDALEELRVAPFVPRATESDARIDEATKVTIDVDVREARRVLALVGVGARIDGAAAGSIRLRFRVADEGAFISWILGLGDSVEVIGPDGLRARVVAALRVAAAAPVRSNGIGS